MAIPDMTLLVGNKNISSWSLRPWLILQHYGITFAEDHVRLDEPASRATIKTRTPAGWVPVLWHKGDAIWDTLAIVEYLAETFPEHTMWPEDARARAVARSVTAEMHSGFATMRKEMAMFYAETRDEFSPSTACQANIDRIQNIFNNCRAEFGADGPFLFGKFSIADAFYAPVISRFRTWGIECEGAAADYCETMWSLPSMQQWYRGAQAELMEARRG